MTNNTTISTREDSDGIVDVYPLDLVYYSVTVH